MTKPQTPSSADWLDVIIKDLVTGVISWNNYGSSKAMDYENEAKQAMLAHIKQMEVEAKIDNTEGIIYLLEHQDAGIVLAGLKDSLANLKALDSTRPLTKDKS